MEELDKNALFVGLSKNNGFKELPYYNKAKENRTNCEPFERLNQRFVSLQKEYADSFESLHKDIESKVCRREYSKGGETIHRGFYSPSSLDLVVSGNSRGRLLKSVPESNRYDYEYLFDDNGRMICSKAYSDEFDGFFRAIAVELFIYEPNRSLAFTYNPCHDYILSFISECQYENGVLNGYATAICNSINEENDCIEINVEEFEYAEHLLRSVCWSRYVPSIPLLEQNKFVFSRDEEGYLSTYTVEPLDGSIPKEDASHRFESYRVKVRRK